MKSHHRCPARFVLIDKLVERVSLGRHNRNAIRLPVEQLRQDLLLSSHIVALGGQIPDLHAEGSQVESGFPDALPQQIEEIFGLEGRNNRNGSFLQNRSSIALSNRLPNSLAE